MIVGAPARCSQWMRPTSSRRMPAGGPHLALGCADRPEPEGFILCERAPPRQERSERPAGRRAWLCNRTRCRRLAQDGRQCVRIGSGCAVERGQGFLYQVSGVVCDVLCDVTTLESPHAPECAAVAAHSCHAVRTPINTRQDATPAHSRCYRL